MTDQEVGAAVATAFATLIAGIVVYQSSKLKALKQQLLQKEYELEKKQIEESVHGLSDDDLRKQLDDFTKKSS